MLTCKLNKKLSLSNISKFFMPVNGKYFRGVCLCSSAILQREGTVIEKAESKNVSLQFAGSRRGCFFQDPPLLGNQFIRDSFLRSCLRRIMPKQILEEISPDLDQFGNRVGSDIYSMGMDCELTPPTLDHFDAWGRRIDRINTCEGWKELHDISAKEGLIAIAYERKYKQWNRIYQAVKLYLFSPSSGLYSCPLAMTDGAAKTLEGSKGLTMFYLETRDSEDNLNNIEVQRLKNKLGTRQLPTAELLLDGTVAHKITDEGRGVAGIASMLTVTRIHNSISAVSAMRRILSLAQDYCLKRTVFGKLLVKHELHMQTLARLEVEVRGAVLLVLEVSRLLGLNDCAMANNQELHLLRLLTPITKLYTAKQAMLVTSEGLESFGGQGYIEDTGLPGIMRDAQVLPIWEGTTNVLSLDVLRSIHKSQGQVLKAFHSSVLSKLSLADDIPDLHSTCDCICAAVNSLLEPKYTEILTSPVVARDLAYSLARIYIGALLVEHASWEEASEIDTEAARRWCLQDLIPAITNLNTNLYDSTSTSFDTALVMDRQTPTIH